MAREFSRKERVGDYLQRELSVLVQRELRDPRVGMVSITDVQVSRDMSHARVYFTLLGCDSETDAKPSTDVLNRAAGFLRSALARDASMRSVPKLRFHFDSSIGRGRDLEALIRRATAADSERGDGQADPENEDSDVDDDVDDEGEGKQLPASANDHAGDQ